MATGHQVSDFSDRAQTRPGLLTGGLLARIQPEEPNLYKGFSMIGR
jgi:hypothetical protein